MIVVLGEMGVARVKPNQSGQGELSVQPYSHPTDQRGGGHQLPGASRRRPHNRWWTASTRPRKHRASEDGLRISVLEEGKNKNRVLSNASSKPFHIPSLLQRVISFLSHGAGPGSWSRRRPAR